MNEWHIQYKITLIILFSILVFYIVLRLFMPHNGIDVNTDKAFNTLKKYNIIAETDLKNKKVTRYDFIVALSKVMGADDKMVSEGMSVMEFPTRYIGDLTEYYNEETETGNHLKIHYIMFTTETTNDFRIVYGKKKIMKFKNFVETVDFAGYDRITVSEAAALCVRCLKTSDTSKIKEYYNARKYGIVNNTDMFATLSGKNYLTHKDMYKMLYRLINMKRYKYFHELDSSSWFDIDKSSSMTYMQYLEIKNSDKYERK